MRWRLLLLLALLSVAAPAQMVISVDSATSRNAGRSLAGAMALSAVIPGTGQYYLGEKSRLQGYVWTDAALWMVCAGSWFFGEQQLSSARSYAERYANASGVSRDADFLDLMGRYRSRGGVQYQNSSPDNDEDYNQAMIRSGQAIDAEYPDAPGYQWDWGASNDPATTAHMSHYKDMLSNYRLSRIFMQVSLGALALNRVVAMLDVLRIYRATSSTDLSRNFQVAPVLGPDRHGAQVFLGF